MNDPYQTAEFAAFSQRARVHLVPKMSSSAAVAALVSQPPGSDFDIRQALEIGVCLLLGKPLIVVADSEEDVPPGLRRAADHLVYGDLASESTREAMTAAIARVGED